MTRRVAITGVGVVSAIGQDAPTFWQACLRGSSSVVPIPERWLEYADYHSKLWSPLDDIDLAALGFDRVEVAQHDPVSLIAVRAATEALEHAGYAPEPHDRRARTYRVPGIDAERAGVYVGTGVGGARSFLRNHAVQVLERPCNSLRAALARTHTADAALEATLARLRHDVRFNPFVVSMLMPNAVSAVPGLRFGFNGPNVTCTLACAAGTAAIGQAYRAVRDGLVDFALAGGSEFLDDEHGGIFRGFDVAGTLVRDCAEPDAANRPFDERRSGFLFAQGGAGMVALEPLDAAKERGTEVIAEVCGYGETFDAHSLMSLAEDGVQIERMLRCALAEAGVPAAEVGLVNAHGTGTERNDATEAEIIRRVFGNHVAVTPTKSLLGHTFGASGALETIATVLSLRDQTTHACRNLESPIADLAFVRDVGKLEISSAVTQSFAFGGHNTCLVLRHPEAA
jgi:3-oxoacyl-[acyl-carrier-protein] synthase II